MSNDVLRSTLWCDHFVDQISVEVQAVKSGKLHRKPMQLSWFKFNGANSARSDGLIAITRSHPVVCELIMRDWKKRNDQSNSRFGRISRNRLVWSHQQHLLEHQVMHFSQSNHVNCLHPKAFTNFIDLFNFDRLLFIHAEIVSTLDNFVSNLKNKVRSQKSRC